MNSKIREFRNSIVQYVNSVDLPIEVKNIVLFGICKEIEIVANDIVQKEMQEEKAKEGKENGNME